MLRRTLQTAGCLWACLLLSSQMCVADPAKSAVEVRAASGPSETACNNRLSETRAPIAQRKASPMVMTDLEHKLFGRVFPTEPAEHRVDRLESFVFGISSEGSVCDRLDRLVLTVLDAVQRVSLQDPGKSTEQSIAADALKTEVVPPVEQVVKEAQLPLTRLNYPRITALERLILGKTFTVEQVGPRLRRLETKVFNKTDDAGNLSERVEKLEAHLHVENVYLLMDNPEDMALEAFATYMNRNPQSNGGQNALPTCNPTLMDFIESLEAKVLGKVQASEPVLERVSTLEAKLFNAPDKDTPVTKRVHRLWVCLYPESQSASGQAAKVADATATDNGPAKKKDNSDPLIAGFELPMNPELEAPKKNISVDGFQLPANPSMSASKELTAADRKSTKHGVLHKFGKVLQVASSTLLAGSSPTFQEDWWNY